MHNKLIAGCDWGDDVNDFLEIFWPKAAPPDILEVSFSYQYCHSTTRRLCESVRGVKWREYPGGWRLHDFLENSASELIMIVTDPEIVFSEDTLRCLLKGAAEGANGYGPVYNLTDVAMQQAVLPVPYLNVTSYVETARYLHGTMPLSCLAEEGLDPACALYRRDYLESVQKIHGGSLSPEKFSTMAESACIVSGALVHKFGKYYDGGREELVDLVPPHVRRILDIGCAKGGYGRLLKQLRPDIWLTGIELNPIMAQSAKRCYDEIITSPVEKAQLDQKYDLVNCGDVLEHLENPWQMLQRIHHLLNDGGYLVLSIPNAGHWTVAMDLLKGKFEYLPVGLICISHLRWFTETSILQALTEAGFEIDILNRQQLTPTSEGKQFIASMSASGFGDEESLLTNEIIIRAIKT